MTKQEEMRQANWKIFQLRGMLSHCYVLDHSGNNKNIKAAKAALQEELSRLRIANLPSTRVIQVYLWDRDFDLPPNAYKVLCPDGKWKFTSETLQTFLRVVSFREEFMHNSKLKIRVL